MQQIKKEQLFIMEIKGRYYIADCEHKGDITNAINYIKSIGGNVYDEYWDGSDCGTAYLEIGISVDTFKKVYKRQAFVMDADINDYITIDDGIKTNKVPYNEFKSIREKMKDGDISANFEENMPIYFFFCKKNKSINAEQVFNDIVNILGKNSTKIIVTTSYISSGDTCYCALLTTNYKNVTDDKMKAIGDFAIGNERNSYIKRNNLYGQCQCIHPLSQYIRDYNMLHWAIMKIKEKQPLNYSNSYRNIMLDHQQYAPNGKFQPCLNINGWNCHIAVRGQYQSETTPKH